MGGMFDTKTDKVKRKQELTQKQQKAQRKSRIITSSVIIVFALAVIAAVLLNSNWLRRTLSVVTIDGVSFNTAQFEYFYTNEYTSLSNAYQEQGMSFMLPDENRPLSSQVYNSQTGETWADLITERTLITLKDITGVYNLAKANGFTLPQDKIDEIEQSMLMLEFEAQYYGFLTADSLLQQAYGAGMNMKIYRGLLEFISLSDAYITYTRDNLQYTPQQIDDYYAENADILDIFNYRVFVVAPAEHDGEDDGTAAMEEAGEKAKSYAGSISSEEDFISAALDYDEVLYADAGSTKRELRGVYFDDANYDDYLFAQWLRDEDRASGDVTTIEVYQGVAVVYFISRENNSYPTAGMRQLLIRRESVSSADYPEGEDDPGYIAAAEAAAKEALERAQLLESLFNEAGRTEQALIDLRDDYSDSDGSPDGLYEGISKYSYQGAGASAMRVVPELEEWLFEPDRKPGDSELIETEAYGYHLVYFTGHGELFSRVMAEDLLRTEDSNKWLENITAGEPVKHAAFILVNR